MNLLSAARRPRAFAARCLPFVFALTTLVSGCYAEADSRPSGTPMITECGLNYVGSDPFEFACLQRQERITLEALSSISTDVQWSREVTCPMLKGTSVDVAPLSDGGTWEDEQFFHLTDDYDRGNYSTGALRIRVSTEDWSNPEFSWQLVRIITRGQGDPADTLFWTGSAIAEAAKQGRDPSVDPLPAEFNGVAR